MISRFHLTIPANTSKEDPQTLDVELPVGVIHKIDIVFPPGCCGLAGVAVFHGLHQVWPSYSDEWFSTDGETISFEEFYEVKPGFTTFTLKGYNEDDTYQHTIIFRFGVLKKSEIQGIWLPWSEEIEAEV